MKYCVPYDIWIEIGNEEFLLIESGFLWNGDTIVADICSANSCLHDFIYSAKKDNLYTVMINGNIEYIEITRLQADKFYKKFLKKHYPLISRTRFIGLRLLGWIFWKKKQPYFIDVNQTYDLKLYTCKHGIQVRLTDGTFDNFKYYKI